MGFIERGLEEMITYLEQEKVFYNNLIDPSLPGGLIGMKRPGGTVYLHSIPVETGDGRTTYSRKSINKHPEVIRSLATNAFAKAAVKISENNLARLRRAQSGIVELTTDNVLCRLRRAYRELPESYYSHISAEGIMEEYRDWMQQPFIQSGHRPENKKFNTGRGIWVRSKSEVMFVEKFFQYGVPFHYEEVIGINGYELAPDFTFPDRLGGKFYLEYCGMMDDPEYVDRFLWKRKTYEGIGITEWNNMIYVFDSNNSLDMNRIDHIIRAEILPRL